MNLTVKGVFLLVSIANFAVAPPGQRFQAVQKSHAAERQQEARVLVLRDVVVIDATGSAPRPGMTVMISGDRIIAIDAASALHIPKNSVIVQATGKFLIPGLWDMHGHLTGARDHAVPLLIANGVTGVRDMGGELNYLRQLRDDIKQRRVPGPRIVFAGPFLDGPKPGVLNRLTITRPDDARNAVDHLKDLGADFIKVHSAIPREAYFALAENANRKDIPFAGHVPDSMTAAEASDAGQASIEHLLPVDETLGGGSDALFQRFTRNNTWAVPTLVSWRPYAFPSDPGLAADLRQRYLPRSVFEEWDRNQPIQTDLSPQIQENRKRVWPRLVSAVGRMQRAGVQLMAGTDFSIRYVYPGFSLHDELELLVQGGLTPMEALQTATSNPARFLGIEATTGTVEAGKSADLIILDADPLKDIRNTRQIWAVVVGGTFVSRDALNHMLKDVQAAAMRN